MTPQPVIGFVGLGQMGYPMARRLAQAGYSVQVKDLNKTHEMGFCDEFPNTTVVQNGDWSGVDYLFLSLPNSEIVEDALLNTENGIVSTLNQGTQIIDLSSSQPHRTQALSKILVESGFRFVDAPVSGGVRGANLGLLSVMVGGPGDQFEEIKPLLSHLGKKIFHVGAIGSGHAAKALNNLVSAASLTVTAEALLVAQKFGIDPHQMNSILNAGSGKTNASENKVEQFILSGEFNSGFGLKLMAKDVHIAVEMAEKLGQNTPVGEVTDDLWTKLVSPSEDTVDHTRIYELLADSGKSQEAITKSSN